MKMNIFLVSLSVMFAAQVFGKDNNDTSATNTPDSPKDYQILLIGNSHSVKNGLPKLITTLVKTGQPGVNAHSDAARGFKFLDERLNNGATQKKLESRSWTHVILQAQKYSTSGRYFYSTDAAEEWIRRVKAQSARPILFPEWPRRGNNEEGQRIHNLHLGISSRESACVAPIGLAWEKALARYPGLRLHVSDGNHSSRSGALLTAFVLYQVITGQSAAELPYIPTIRVSADMQKNLREIAAVVVIENQAGCDDIDLIPDDGDSSSEG